MSLTHGRWRLSWEPRDLRPARAAPADGTTLKRVLRDPWRRLIRLEGHCMLAVPASYFYVRNAGCEQIICNGCHPNLTVSVAGQNTANAACNA
jgi:hypothetical protein